MSHGIQNSIDPDWIRSINRHFTRKIHPGSAWVRLAPMDSDDIEHTVVDPIFMPFVREGAVVHAYDEGRYVSAQIQGTSVLYEREIFLRTFLALVMPEKWARFQIWR